MTHCPANVKDTLDGHPYALAGHFIFFKSFQLVVDALAGKRKREGAVVRFSSSREITVPLNPPRTPRSR